MKRHGETLLIGLALLATAVGAIVLSLLMLFYIVIYTTIACYELSERDQAITPTHGPVTTQMHAQGGDTAKLQPAAGVQQ